MDACVICVLHSMDGLDFHDSLPGPLLFWGPHLVGVRFLFGASKKNMTVLTPYGPILSRGFDIGWFIPHLPLPLPNNIQLFWLWSIFSGSVGYFGVSSVEAPEGAIAAASDFYTNVQLDCGGPVGSPPTPTGLVFAPNTVIAGMTLGDVIAGLLTMAVTAYVQWKLSILIDGLGPIVLKGILRAANPVDAKLFEFFWETLKNQSPVLAKFLNELAGNLVQGELSKPIGEMIEEVTGCLQQAIDHGVTTDDYFDSPDLPPPFPRLPGSVPIPILIL